MTDLQVKYQQLEESKRANLENEELKRIANALTEQENKAKLISAQAAQQQADTAQRKEKFNEVYTLLSGAFDTLNSEKDWFRGLLLPTVRDLGSGASGAGSIMKGIAALFG